MLKKTKTRELVKSLLEKCSEPLTASEIYEKLKDNNITLSSVYRTLEAFYNNSIVSKDVTPEGISKYSIHKDEHKHFLECKKCHKSTELDYCPYTQANKKIKNKTNFVVDEHNLIIYGVCKDCNENR